MKTKRGFKERNARMQAMSIAGPSKLILAINPSIGSGVNWRLSAPVSTNEPVLNAPRLLTKPELMEMQ